MAWRVDEVDAMVIPKTRRRRGVIVMRYLFPVPSVHGGRSFVPRRSCASCRYNTECALKWSFPGIDMHMMPMLRVLSSEYSRGIRVNA